MNKAFAMAAVGLMALSLFVLNSAQAQNVLQPELTQSRENSMNIAAFQTEEDNETDDIDIDDPGNIDDEVVEDEIIDDDSTIDDSLIEDDDILEDEVNATVIVLEETWIETWAEDTNRTVVTASNNTTIVIIEENMSDLLNMTETNETEISDNITSTEDDVNETDENETGTNITGNITGNETVNITDIDDNNVNGDVTGETGNESEENNQSVMRIVLDEDWWTEVPASVKEVLNETANETNVTEDGNLITGAVTGNDEENETGNDTEGQGIDDDSGINIVQPGSDDDFNQTENNMTNTTNNATNTINGVNGTTNGSIVTGNDSDSGIVIVQPGTGQAVDSAIGGSGNVGGNNVGSDSTAENVQVTEDGDLMEGSVEVKSNIEVGKQQTVFGEVLVANLSNGQTAEVRIMPSTASEIAIQTLGTTAANAEDVKIVLKEVGTGDDSRPVYLVKVPSERRFLGIFRTTDKVQVDAETGAIIENERMGNRPITNISGNNNGAAGIRETGTPGAGEGGINE